MSSILDLLNNCSLKNVVITNQTVDAAPVRFKAEAGTVAISLAVDIRIAEEDADKPEHDRFYIDLYVDVEGYTKSDKNQEDPVFNISGKSINHFEANTPVTIDQMKDGAAYLARECYQCLRAYLMVQARAAGIPFSMPFSFPGDKIQVNSI